MAYLAPRLRKRIQFRQAVQTPNTTTGGYDRSYTTLTTVWAGFKPIRKGYYMRGVQTENDATHEFEVRKSALSVMGKAFSKAFSTAFDSSTDLNIVKSNFFIFVQHNSTSVGRSFRIRTIENKNERDERYLIEATEIEELGTGYSA